MKREKIALSERQRVCDFSFMSDEFINFCRQMSGLRVFVFTCPCHVSMSCKLVFYFPLVPVQRLCPATPSPHQKRGALAPLAIYSKSYRIFVSTLVLMLQHLPSKIPPMSMTQNPHYNRKSS